MARMVQFVMPFRFVAQILATVGKQGIWVGLTLTLAVVGIPSLSIADSPSSVAPSVTEAIFLDDVGTELAYLKEETVVTPLQHEQPISQAPSNVYVITAEDIHQSGATDLPTILRRVPGIEVMQVTGADINVSVRGNRRLQNNKMLVLVDGRSIYNDGQGIVFWKLLPVPLSEIRQVEVVLGPTSVLYGFNAFDGIVNILTKSGRDLQGTHLQAGGGDWGTWTGSLLHGQQLGAFSYQLSSGWNQQQQWRDREALAFRAYQLHTAASYQVTDTAHFRGAGGYVESNHFDGTLFESTFSHSSLSQGFVQAGYEDHWGHIHTSWTRSTYNPIIYPHPLLGNLFRHIDAKGDEQGHFTTNTYNLDLQFSHAFGAWGRLTTGVNLRHNTLESNFIDRFRTEQRAGLLVQAELSPVASVTTIAGVRYDLDTFINPIWSPRVAVVWTPIENHTLRATFSVGYRPPTLFETYVSIFQPVITDGPGDITRHVRPNTNQLPEKITSYEIGYQGWFFHHRIRLRATGFVNDISQLIDTRPDPANGPGEKHTIYLTRREEARILGWELGLEWLATSWLRGFVNYAYQQYQENIGDKSTTAVRPTGPQVKINAGLRGQWAHGLSVELLYHHTDQILYPLESAIQFAPLFGHDMPDQHVGNYHLFNARAGWWIWADRLEVAVSAFNVLNDRQREHPLGDSIGRRVMGWLTVKL